MRRRTALGLGAVLAGSVLFGAGGTVAVLSDTASMSAEAGAGSLSLSNASSRPGKVQLQLGKTAEISLRADTGGSEGVVLQVSVVENPGAAACPTAALLTIGVPSVAGLQETPLCQLDRPSTFLLELDGSADAVDVPMTVMATALPATRASDISWEGYLRFTLRHAHGGFSDQEDVAVHVVTPPGQSGSAPGQGGANPGNGQRGGVKDKDDRSASTAATGVTPGPQPAPEQSPNTATSASGSAQGEATPPGTGEPTTPADAGEPTTTTGAEAGAADAEGSGA
ncbi:hypothetical protein ACI782_15890 [Geodermatophilus sp. SYSU D00703]